MSRSRLPALVLVALGAAAARSASAQTVIEADGLVGYSWDRTTPAGENTGRVDVRPSLTLHFGSPRVVWRLGYTFSGSYGVEGTVADSYGNELVLALAAELTERTTLSLGATATQGGTRFRLSQQEPQAGEPSIRPPGDPDMVTVDVTQSLAYEASEDLGLGQSLGVSVSAPQEELDPVNWVASGSLSFARAFGRNALGLELASRFARFRPLVATADSYQHSVVNALQARWSRDLGEVTDMHVAAGVEQAIEIRTGAPATYHPAGSFTLSYHPGRLTSSLAASSGVLADPGTGTVSLSNEVVLHAGWQIDPVLVRELGVSAGYLETRPIRGASDATGKSVQGDVGVVWGLTETFVFNARYSVAYQFDQPGGIAPSTVHVVLCGLSFHWRSASHMPPMPGAGGRVDGSDRVSFPGAPGAAP